MFCGRGREEGAYEQARGFWQGEAMKRLTFLCLPIVASLLLLTPVQGWADDDDENAPSNPASILVIEPQDPFDRDLPIARIERLVRTRVDIILEVSHPSNLERDEVSLQRQVVTRRGNIRFRTIVEELRFVSRDGNRFTFKHKFREKLKIHKITTNLNIFSRNIII